MKFKFLNFLAAAVAVVTVSSMNFAQQSSSSSASNPPSSPQIELQDKGFRKGMRGMHGMRGEHQGMMLLRMINELNLTDAQKQQANTIVENHKIGTQSQKEELRQIFSQKQLGATALTAEQETRARELSSQLRVANKKMNDDLLALLTPEQRQQLNQKQLEMRQKWQERRQMRQNNQTNQTTPQN